MVFIFLLSNIQLKSVSSSHEFPPRKDSDDLRRDTELMANPTIMSPFFRFDLPQQ